MADHAALLGTGEIGQQLAKEAVLESRCKTLLGERKAMQASWLELKAI